MKIGSLFTLTSLIVVAACGDDGGSPPSPDAPPVKDIGFNKPTAPLKANEPMGQGQYRELGPANLACLNMPSDDQATTVPVEITASVEDFQSGDPVPGAAVSVFRDQDVSSVIGNGTADGTATVVLNLPVGVKRFGYKITHESAMDTLLLNQRVAPGTAQQNVGGIQSVSKTTAQLLPALIGLSRTAGTGVLAGAMRDCAGNEVSNFIATVSSTRGTVTHLPGADTYYFSATAGLPVKHMQQAASSANALFMVVELPVTASAYVQVWGYPTDADVAADNLTLIAELPTAVIGDTVITGSYEPLRAP
jgi:hypothetical protein